MSVQNMLLIILELIMSKKVSFSISGTIKFGRPELHMDNLLVHNGFEFK